MAEPPSKPEPEPFGPTSTLPLAEKAPFRIRRCRLTIAAGPGAGRSVTTEKERIRVGSGAGCDLVLEDRGASRAHFELRHTRDGYLLVDLGSTNGTLVDGKRVERAYVATEAHVVAGATTVTVTPIDEALELEPVAEDRFEGMIGRSERMRRLFAMIARVAPLDVGVIVTGETGTGKEKVAQAIHARSPRGRRPLVVVDCGAIHPELIESELFGHERGAFTGAGAARAGAFERANGGTIFLDEIGELRTDLQPKLLRVLEARRVTRVGGAAPLELDLRVIAATHRDLEQQVAAGKFREDLYFRLAVVTLELPPLRERPEDVRPIAEALLARPEVVDRLGRRAFTEEALALLARWPWPGNVRELVNVVRHALALSSGAAIGPEALPAHVRGDEVDEDEAGAAPDPVAVAGRAYHEAKDEVLATFERRYLLRMLEACEGNLSEAARRSGVDRKTIERLVRKFGVDPSALKAR